MSKADAVELLQERAARAVEEVQASFDVARERGQPLLANVALVDPELTHSMPPAVTAASGRLAGRSIRGRQAGTARHTSSGARSGPPAAGAHLSSHFASSLRAQGMAR